MASAAEIKEATRIAAQIVKRDGAAFLSVFEFMEMELEKSSGANDTFSRAMAMAAE